MGNRNGPHWHLIWPFFVSLADHSTIPASLGLESQIPPPPLPILLQITHYLNVQCVNL